jgi:hypothetical protein
MISFWQRLKYACRAFFSILFHGRIAGDITDALVPGEPAPVPVPAPIPAAVQDTGDRALQMLALLQRDGRLIDFLMEDLAPYDDAQVGAAVRDVHAGCRGTLGRYTTLEPVIDDEEGRPITVDRGADPARITVVGNLAGGPPFRGVLRHRGWEAIRVELPPLPPGGRAILAPAEVEVA